MGTNFIGTGLGGTPAPGTSWTTIDLASGTEGNTGVKGSNTSLGETSTIEAAQVHGYPDAGLDAWWNLTNIGAKPSGSSTLLLRLSFTTGPTTTPNSNACMLVYVSPSAGMVNTEGYTGGFIRGPAGVDKPSNCNLMGSGSSPSGDTLATEPCVANVMVTWSGSTARYITSHVYDDGTATGENAQATNSGGSFTDIYIGICVGQQNATPSALVKWEGVVLEYQWV